MFSIKNLFIFFVLGILYMQACHADYHLLFAGKINDATYFEIGTDHANLGSAFVGNYLVKMGPKDNLKEVKVTNVTVARSFFGPRIIEMSKGWFRKDIFNFSFLGSISGCPDKHHAVLFATFNDKEVEVTVNPYQEAYKKYLEREKADLEKRNATEAKVKSSL